MSESGAGRFLCVESTENRCDRHGGVQFDVEPPAEDDLAEPARADGLEGARDVVGIGRGRRAVVQGHRPRLLLGAGARVEVGESLGGHADEELATLGSVKLGRIGADEGDPLGSGFPAVDDLGKDEAGGRTRVEVQSAVRGERRYGSAVPGLVWNGCEPSGDVRDGVVVREAPRELQRGSLPDAGEAPLRVGEENPVVCRQ